MNTLTTRNMHILSGYVYHPTKGPCLQVDHIASQPTTRHILPIWKQYVHFIPLSTRYCIGRYDVSTGRAICCPLQEKAMYNSLHCSSCSKTLVFKPAFYRINPSQLSAWQQNYNRQPHCVYLAYFGKGAIKVGIAHFKRVNTRWLEQGARAAVVLQQMPDAYAARAMEEWISRTYAIQERMSSIQKQKYLLLRYDFSAAMKELMDCRQAIYKELNTVSLSYPIQDLQKYYFFKSQPTNLYQPPKAGDYVMVGYGLGMAGDIVVYEQEGYAFVQSIKPYMAQTQVVLHKQPIEVKPQIQTQLDLFR